MYDVVATETFAAELENVFDYLTLPPHSNHTAKDFKESLDGAVSLLAEFPDLAAVSRKPLLRECGLREWYFGDYALVYRNEGGTIYLEHLFHQRQDYENLV